MNSETSVVARAARSCVDGLLKLDDAVRNKSYLRSAAYWCITGPSAAGKTEIQACVSHRFGEK